MKGYISRKRLREIRVREPGLTDRMEWASSQPRMCSGMVGVLPPLIVGATVLREGIQEARNLLTSWRGIV